MRRTTLIGVALAILVFAIYGGVARNGFVDYDDPAYITDNPHVRSGMSFETVVWALGAILLTGYLGGAVCTHIRAGEYGQAIAPFAFGVVLWLGLFFRDARIRQLAPLRTLN